MFQIYTQTSGKYEYVNGYGLKFDKIYQVEQVYIPK